MKLFLVVFVNLKYILPKCTYVTRALMLSVFAFVKYMFLTNVYECCVPLKKSNFASELSVEPVISPSARSLAQSKMLKKMAYLFCGGRHLPTIFTNLGASLCYLQN